MGFPSPAADFKEQKLSLDQHCNTNNPSVYFFRCGTTSLREGIKSGALLIVDFGATPVDGSIVVCAIEGEFRLMRLRRHPTAYLQHLDHLEQTYGLIDSNDYEIRGVITHILTDARTGEFVELS
ncbi:sOS mutagenesis and repair protein UmuD [Enterobacter quasiroggenkampii]|uniref:HumD family translesion DNA polymerase n=1 Tax=Enterobacter quasiroggenkampii TaxID=2497436 RepID=UPI0021CEC25A|nr:S24 family peptidase [Enterobacter quasiroggenkampii]MCU6401186.1 sOS mutagenesis and repair protein UmuD [Enterobacter quasiroggenkampii]